MGFNSGFSGLIAGTMYLYFWWCSPFYRNETHLGVWSWL